MCPCVYEVSQSGIGVSIRLLELISKISDRGDCIAPLAGASALFTPTVITNWVSSFLSLPFIFADSREELEEISERKPDVESLGGNSEVGFLCLSVFLS